MLLDIAARALLLPVLLGQAIYLRMNVPCLPEPEGARSGTVGQGPELRLLILGDSSAAGVGVSSQADALLGQVTQRLAINATVTFDLIAKTGAKTSAALSWLDTLPDQQYDYVVTGLGVNDVTKGVSLRRWLHQQNTLFDRLVAKYGVRCVIVSGLPPVGQFPVLPHPLRWVLGRQAARFDRYLHQLVESRPDCVAVRIDLGLDESNMSEDGFHPDATVYSAWADEVSALIRADGEMLDGAEPTP